MTPEQLIQDLAEMIAADLDHLQKALVNGDRTAAHSKVDSIINRKRELEDLKG
jgi:hypothetical protein